MQEGAVEPVNWQTFEADGLCRLLIRLGLEKRMGCLSLVNGDQQVHFYLYGGEPGFVHSPRATDSVQQKLVERGWVTAENLGILVGEATEKNGSLAYLAVEKGWITPDQLLGLLREEIVAALQTILTWEKGYWIFQERDLDPRSRVDLALPPWGWLKAGVEAAFPLKRLLAWGLQPEGVLNRGPTPLVPLAELGATAERLFALAASSPRVDEVLAKSGLEARETLQHLFLLSLFGHLDVAGVGAKESASKPGPVIIEPERNVKIEAPPEPMELSPNETTFDLKPRIPAVKDPGGEDASLLKGRGPEILGEVDALQREYEEKRSMASPPPTPAVEPPPTPQGGEITLDPAAMKRAMMEKKAPSPRKQEEAVRSAKSEPAPAPEPSAVVEKVAVTPPRPKPGRERNDLDLEQGERFGGLIRFLRGTLGFLVAIVLMGLAIWFVVFHDPLRAQSILEEIRLQQMYGRKNLDAKRKGKFYLDDGQILKARRAFEAAVTKAPQDYEVRLHLARVEMLLGDWEAALQNFSMVVKVNPALADARWGLGWCYLRQGDVTRARREFLEYLNFAPESAEKDRIRILTRALGGSG